MGYLRGFSERGIDFDAATRTFSLPAPNPAAEAFLDSRFARSADRARWLLAAKVSSAPVSLLRSVASGRTATAETIERRRRSCFGDATTPACTALERTRQGAFCRECACGRLWLARFDGTPTSKATFGYLECPRGMPGFSNEVRA